MSDPALDALAESARNRGLKLVRSRVRSPGKRRFGKVGLSDASGKPVFGMDAKGATARPEEVEDYLRNLGARDWGQSLDVAVLPRKRKPSKVSAGSPEARPVKTAPPPKPKPKAKPKPVLKIRDAKPADAPELVELMSLLGHEVDSKGVRKRLSFLAKQKLPQLVATLDKKVVGLAGLHVMTAIHRDEKVGRITILVVAESARERGIGRALCESAEQKLRDIGCRLIEITSNDRLTQAHAFYRHMGYERSSIRFFKKL